MLRDHGLVPTEKLNILCLVVWSSQEIRCFSELWHFELMGLDIIVCADPVLRLLGSTLVQPLLYVDDARRSEFALHASSGT